MTQQTPPTASTETRLDRVRNFRDLGGLPAGEGRSVRHGRLFRSGHLAHASESDAVFLASLRLHTIFDFRNSSDMTLEGPDVALPGVRNVNMPLSDPAAGARFWHVVRNGDLHQLRSLLGDGKGARHMVQSYRRLVLEHTAEHGRMLELLAEEASVPTLLHCAAGKDRAGTAIAVILLALGVERDVIEHDYLESNALHHRYRVQRATDAPPTASPEVAELLGPLFEARAEYLATAFDTIDEQWGSADRYLSEGLGCTAARRERLRALLLA